MLKQHASVRSGDASAAARVAFAAAVDYPSVWELEREVGEALCGVGAFASAAERFSAIHEWDLVAECLSGAGKREAAREVLTRELEKRPTHARLLCALGDLDDDPTRYEAAWAASNERDARAARSLGRRHQTKREWGDAAVWYQRALAREDSAGAWFNLGFVRMQAGDAADDAEKKVQLAAACAAFARCAAIEGDCADAWANLAACKLRLGLSAHAKHALDRAVRARPDDWRLWENAARCGLALGDVAHAVHALGRSLDLAPSSGRRVAHYGDVVAAAAAAPASPPADASATPALGFDDNPPGCCEPRPQSAHSCPGGGASPARPSM